MYKQALGAFVAHFSIFLAFAALATFLDEVDLGSSFVGVKIVLSGLLAFYCHRMILLGDDFGWDQVIAKRSKFGNSIKLWPFMWRLLLATTLFILSATAIFFQLREVVESALQGPDVFVVGFLLSALIALPLYGIALALFGTVFPAASINADASLSTAFTRGKARFWITLWRLFIGFFCFSMAGVAAYVSASVYFGYQTAADGVFYYVLSFGATLLGCFSTLLAATALSMAYQEAGTPSSE